MTKKKPSRKQKRFTEDEKSHAKKLFIEKQWSRSQVAREMGCSTQTISRWCRATDEHGKTWEDYRKERAEQYYLDLSQQNMAQMIMKRTYDILQNKSLEDTKLADALLKMQKIMRELLDPALQIPTMYRMLEDFVLWSKREHPELVDENFLECVRGFKNHIRGRVSLEF